MRISDVKEFFLLRPYCSALETGKENDFAFCPSGCGEVGYKYEVSQLV